MGQPVGGSPDTISTGAQDLRSAGRSIGTAAAGITKAGSLGSAAAVTDPMAGAISRFAAAFAQTTSDIETEMLAASSLAANAAADLATAGGAPARPR